MSRRRIRWLTAITVVVIGVGTPTAFVLANDDDETEPELSTAPPETESVAVQDLVEYLRESGTLGYADTRTISVSKQGLLTWLPEENTELKRGDEVARVNNVPVVLLYGDIPFYRTLEYGIDDGPDVEQLKKNLDKLGMLPDGVTVDEEFTWGTRQAVKNLQEKLGLEETGTIDPSDFVVLPGAVRVGASDAESAKVGDPASGPLYQVSGADREVTAELDSSDALLIGEGDSATVTLPDGSTTAATVTDVGSATANQEGDAVAQVTLALDDPSEVAEGAGIPVGLELVAEVTDDVLAVPVTALVALAEGGYAVEVLDGDGTTRLVAVDPGKYADGVVEVEGDLAEGDEVVVPS